MNEEQENVQLESAIARHLADWSVAHVELAIYETDVPSSIANAIASFCRRHLGVEIDGALFYRSSIGAVAGLRLTDGRRVVLKANQPELSREELEEVVRLRNEVARVGGPSPEVLVGPAPLGRGLAIVERFSDAGALRDAHEPEVRRALASSLCALITTLLPFVATSRLPLRSGPPEGALWPTPHSRLFDFGATQMGAEYIDRVAAVARDAMQPAGQVVLGHGDWRAEHVRFTGIEPAVAFDWDSLRKEREPALVGSTAHAFCADWTKAEHAQAPSLSEAREFVKDYADARGQPFSSEEKRLCAAGFAYAVAYSARCAHSLGLDQRGETGTFQHLIATHGLELLDL